MRSSIFTILLVIPLLALAAGGCGGSEVDADEVPGGPATLTVPSDTDLGAGGSNADESASGTDEDADAEATPEAGTEDSGTATPPADTSGGTTVPETQSAPAAPEETAPEEAPAAEDTPPEQFESFCEQNEGAC